MRACAVAVLAVVGGCTSHVEGPRATEMPFGAGPAVTWTEGPKGPQFEVDLKLQREVKPADALTLIVRVGADEVGKYPITGKAGALVRQPLDLPLGDYDVEVAYKGQRFAGDPFRIAVVPEWGGAKKLHVFRHHGTRISLRDRKLWLLRWWANEAPAQPWLVEWRKDGAVVTTTSGREARWKVPGANAFVRETAQARGTIWRLGEEYAVPDVVATRPGAWEARIVRDGAPPVAVAFAVAPGGKLAESASELELGKAGWSHAWSRPLALRSLEVTESGDLAARLPIVAGAQKLDDGPIQLTSGAVRALFRSKQLAAQWGKYLDAGLKGPTPALRAEVEKLIKTNSGPWKPDEFPRS